VHGDMVSAGEYGACEARRRPEASPAARSIAPKVAGMMALALCAVVCVAVLSDKMGGSAELVQTELHSSVQDYDVADAILTSAGIHDKKGSISASMASLAAQAAKEKETGQLTATVSLPQIPKSIAKMAAEAKHEIQIEEGVDKKRQAVKNAAKAAAEKKLAAKRAAAKVATAKAEAETKAASKADIKEVQKVSSTHKVAPAAAANKVVAKPAAKKVVVEKAAATKMAKSVKAAVKK